MDRRYGDAPGVAGLQARKFIARRKAAYPGHRPRRHHVFHDCDDPGVKRPGSAGQARCPWARGLGILGQPLRVDAGQHLSRVRHPRSRFRPRLLRRVPARFPDRMLPQMSLRVPLLQHAAHGRDHGTPGRSRLPAATGAAGPALRGLAEMTGEARSMSGRLLSYTRHPIPTDPNGGSGHNSDKPTRPTKQGKLAFALVSARIAVPPASTPGPCPRSA
jgi:hypothetical protein